MKVYTLQHKGVLSNTDSNGFYITKLEEPNTEIDIEIFEDMTIAYEWMSNEYSKRVNLPNDRNLIWVFNEPVLFNLEHLDDTFEQFTFEVPMEYFKNNFLWSDYSDWHLHLNYIDGWENEFGIFDINPKKELAQGVTTRLHKDWLIRKTIPTKIKEIKK